MNLTDLVYIGILVLVLWALVTGGAPGPIERFFERPGSPHIRRLLRLDRDPNEGSEMGAARDRTGRRRRSVTSPRAASVGPLTPSARRSTKKTEAAVATVVATLRRIVVAGEAERPGLLRRLANQMVELRACFMYDGQPDWAGRSQAYRDAVYRAYEEAEVPADQVDRIQRGIRYHVAGVVQRRSTANRSSGA